MKYTNFLLLPLSICLFNIAEASTQLPAKQVSLPFYNEPIISNDHAGLVFAYDMNGTETWKVVCRLNDIYKSWVKFSDNGTPRETHTFGNYQTVIFTAKGKTEDQGETISVYHADAVGNMKINEVESNGTATCYYAMDVSSK